MGFMSYIFYMTHKCTFVSNETVCSIICYYYIYIYNNITNNAFVLSCKLLFKNVTHNYHIFVGFEMSPVHWYFCGC